MKLTVIRQFYRLGIAIMLLAGTSCAQSYSNSIARSAIGGKGIDAAFAALPEMYAFFPMIATQSTSPSDHIRPSAVRDNLRDYIIHSRLRDHLLAHLMRPSEMMVAALSPLFRLWTTLKRRPASSEFSGETAK